MKIAIVGAGLAGLACCYFLSKNTKYRVSLFDDKDSLSASQVGAGLCHALSSDGSRLCYKGLEALSSSFKLLDQVETLSYKQLCLKNNLSKLAQTNKEKQILSNLPRKYSGMCWNPYSETYEGFGVLNIEEGRTVFLEPYLKELLSICLKQNVDYERKKILSSELKEFNRVIYALGAGISEFDKILPFKIHYLKGQLLYVKYHEELSQSLLYKGYIAKTQKPYHYYLGSTYERYYNDVNPNLEVAKRTIFSNLNPILDLDKVEILDCLSAVRVCNPTSHLPIIYRASEKCYFITALGSRGLLYHALLGQMISSAISNNSDSFIDQKFYQKKEKSPF